MSVQTLKPSQSKKQYLQIVSNSSRIEDEMEKQNHKKQELTSVRSFSLMVDRNRDCMRNKAIVTRDKLVPDVGNNKNKLCIPQERMSMPHSSQHNPHLHKTVVLCERPTSARNIPANQLHPCQSTSLITRPISSQPLKMHQ